jgi:hypothetical protein
MPRKRLKKGKTIGFSLYLLEVKSLRLNPLSISDSRKNCK